MLLIRKQTQGQVVLKAIDLIYLHHRLVCILVCDVFNIIVAARVNRKKPKLTIIFIFNFDVRAITSMSYDIFGTRLVYLNINSFRIIKITTNISHPLHCMKQEILCKYSSLLLYGTKM